MSALSIVRSVSCAAAQILSAGDCMLVGFPFPSSTCILFTSPRHAFVTSFLTVGCRCLGTSPKIKELFFSRRNRRLCSLHIMLMSRHLKAKLPQTHSRFTTPHLAGWSLQVRSVLFQRNPSWKDNILTFVHDLFTPSNWP